MKIILSVAAVMLVTLGWLVHVTRSASAPEPTTTTSVASEPATHARQHAPRMEVRTPSRAEVVAPAPRDEPDLSITGQRTRLEGRFAAETPDTRWASTAQQELRADLGRFVSRDVGVSDVTCHASLCRIELALATRDAASMFMESWLRKRTWTGPGVADNEAVGPDGQPRMVLFVAKDGVEL